MKILQFYIVFLLCVFSFNKAQQIPYKIEVDLSQKQKKESVAGFLHFTDLKRIEKDVDLLKPKFWRAGAKLKDKTIRKEQINLLLQKNIIPIFVLSDVYDWWPWAKRPTGWINLNSKSDLNEIYSIPDMLTQEWGDKIIYDLWNEPDLKDCWNGSRDDFFKAVKIIHDRIRSSPNGKNAKITGPSISSYNKEYINDFLAFCNQNNIQLDILNWHALGTQKDAVKLKDNIEEARKLLQQYPNVKVKNIYIPEIVGLSEQFNPLTAFTYLNSLEKSGASGGCKACWDNPYQSGENSCWNNSMDGILTSDGKARASWWLYKYYAESLEGRFKVTVNSDSIVGLGYFSKDTNSVNVLFGNLMNPNVSISIDLKSAKKLALFSSSKKVNYTLYKLPNNQNKELKKPIAVKSGSIALTNSIYSVGLSSIDKDTVYLLEIKK